MGVRVDSARKHMEAGGFNDPIGLSASVVRKDRGDAPVTDSQVHIGKPNARLHDGAAAHDGVKA
jgi:hypothetical protein